jgi:hypothetical protein
LKPARRIHEVENQLEHAMHIRPTRRSNRTVDTNFYRQEAFLLRREAANQIFRRLWLVGRPLIGTAAIIAAYASALHLMFAAAAAAEVPDAIATPGEVLVTTAHAVGAQVYECRSDSAGKLVWQFREPIATLFIAGKTVGRHYAGPNWEMIDGSTVSGKVAAQVPGAGPNDIPLLKLEAASWHGTGQLSRITTIQRLNTRGGRVDATCDSVGTFLSVPYSADYAFYKKGG